jgi:hypothetical protein
VRGDVELDIAPGRGVTNGGARKQGPISQIVMRLKKEVARHTHPDDTRED